MHIWRMLSLRNDQAPYDVIDSAVRGNAQVAGTNLWVLMFAILIASVGLNVNSTAVIIGAMLISPLMGPIIGIGYGAGIHDYVLIRNSLRNLMVFVGISLLASTVYFTLTPLTTAHSELLARTSPTLWDVLIAFFGGAAGMIGLTRKEKTTLIPGVAIATALMPPICTAGYGIATGQFQYFLGAFYLFLINSVFIALATLAIVRILRLPHHAFPNEAARTRGRIVIALAVTLTLVPSVFLAYRLVQEEVFTASAEAFVHNHVLSRDNITLLTKDIDPKKRLITLTVLGEGAQPAFEQSLNDRLADNQLEQARIRLIEPSAKKLDLDSLKQELQQDVLRNTVLASQANAQRIVELEAQLQAAQAANANMRQLETEIRAQLPHLKHVVVTSGQSLAASEEVKPLVFVAIEVRNKLPSSETERLKRWLRTRLPDVQVELMVGKMSS